LIRVFFDPTQREFFDPQGKKIGIFREKFLNPRVADTQVAKAAF